MMSDKVKDRNPASFACLAGPWSLGQVIAQSFLIPTYTNLNGLVGMLYASLVVATQFECIFRSDSADNLD